MRKDCQNTEGIVNALHTLFRDAVVEVLKRHNVPIFSFHIAYTPREHLHAWIHTHDPSTANVDSGCLVHPLHDDDPLVLLGADPRLGTARSPFPQNYASGGRGRWEDSDRIEEFETDQFDLKITEFLAGTKSKKGVFYIFYISESPENVIVSFEPPM